MVAYRLRIELPDRPGALAGVTSAIAAANANIVSIDVHEIDGTTAVDEIVVEVADGWAPAPLAAALVQSGGGILLSSRRMTSTEDPVTSALRAVTSMVSDGPSAVDGECRQALLALAHGSSARLLDLDAASRDQTGRLALDRRSTIVARDGDASTTHGWVLAALDDAHDPTTVALVTRPLNVRFSATEVSRVEALMRLCRLLGATRPRPEAGAVPARFTAWEPG
jgi:hypothetical protein